LDKNESIHSAHQTRLVDRVVVFYSNADNEHLTVSSCLKTNVKNDSTWTS